MITPDPKMSLALAQSLWGWKPHKTQRKWLLDESSTKVAACGRRWGKTEAAAIDAATMAILQQGSTQIIVSPTCDQSRLIFGSVEQFIMGSPITRGISKVTRTPYPRLRVGRSVIMARTVDEDGRNLRGHSADRVIVDEAAYVRDSVVQEVIAPMLADRDGRLVMISTPFGKNHFYRAFMKGAQSRGQRAKGKYASFTFPSWENPHISREYIERQREEISPRQFSVEYEAKFLDDTNSVFEWSSIQSAADRSEATCDRDPNAIVVAGIDWARYSDYTALVAIAIEESGLRVIGIERFNNIGWAMQVERVAEFLDEHGVTEALADATSVGDPLLEQLQTKLWDTGANTSVAGFTFTNASKRDLIDALSLRFARGTISIPREENLMRELQYYEYELTAAGNIRMNARTGCHDDLVIALALACRQAKTAGPAGSVLGQSGRVAVKGW